MKLALVYIVAAAILPFAFLLHVLIVAWEWWHFGPSEWVLKFLRWLNRRAFKRVSEWALRTRRAAQRQGGE